MIRIRETDLNFDREPVIRPFGFKGGFVTELRQTATKFVSDTANATVGIAGMSETNGNMNYTKWNRMVGYHPKKDASLTRVRDGVLELDDDHAQSGCIFDPYDHYNNLVR